MTAPTQSDRAPVPAISAATRCKAIIAATIGNGLEWLNFTVHSFFAVITVKLFFPTGSDFISSILTVATSGVGSFMRLVSAVVLGIYIDHVGRKATFTLAIMLMVIGTIIIGPTSTYVQAGIDAPILIVTARLTQGLSAGGEAGGAMALLIGYSPDERRGYPTGWQRVSQGISFVLGAAMDTIVTNGLPPGQTDAWGWCIPFLFSLLIGPVNIYIRPHLHEPPAFEARKAKAAKKSCLAPLSRVLRDRPYEVLGGLGMTIFWVVCTYALVFYMPTYVEQQLGLPLGVTFQLTALCKVIISASCPLMGTPSGRIGRKRMSDTVALVIAAVAYPPFHRLSVHPTMQILLQVQAIPGVSPAVFTGPAPVILAEQLPMAMRSTGLSISHSLAVIIFDGFVPLTVTWLIASSSSKLVSSYHAVAAAIISALVLSLTYDRMGKPTEKQ